MLYLRECQQIVSIYNIMMFIVFSLYHAIHDNDSIKYNRYHSGQYGVSVDNYLIKLTEYKHNSCQYGHNVRYADDT